MKNRNYFFWLFLIAILILLPETLLSKPIRVKVITGGHNYDMESFNEMLGGLGKRFDFDIVTFPEAFSLFLPGNRDNYDVLLLYHMWKDISEEDALNFSETIRNGKPLVVLHHSICAFDDWTEYMEIIGGKYFHKTTVIDGKEYPASTYIHDLRFTIQVSDPSHPATRGLRDFEVFDETYSGFYVHPASIPLLTTREPSSTPVVGWTKEYGKSQVVTLQSGHDSHTFANPLFRKLLKQSIMWVRKHTR